MIFLEDKSGNVIEIQILSLKDLYKANDLIAESWVCDTYKLQQEIAFKPKYSLEQAMQKTIKWYQDNELL